MSIAKTVHIDERGIPQKMQGWHSWRHQTREAQDAAREKYLSLHGPSARRTRAAARRAAVSQ